MIIEHLLDDNNLTNTEKSIAQFLLNKDQKINNLTSSELGKQSYTSQAAVTRLYKKLGFNNFREFLSTLILEKEMIILNIMISQLSILNSILHL